MSKFNIGDKVRVKDGGAMGLEGFIVRFNPAGLAIIKSINSGGDSWAFTWYVGYIGQWAEYRLTLLEAAADRTRLEGQVIDYKDVKVGDRILVTYDEDDWGQVTTVEGVVDILTTAPDGATVFKTKKTYTSAIFMSTWDMVKDITLVKAAVPESTDEEKLTTQLKEAKYNQVIHASTTIARKWGIGLDGKWTVSNGHSTTPLTSEELSKDLISKVPLSSVKFLK